MPVRKSAEDIVRRINATNVKVNGAWMPCEYVRNASGRYRIMMLADIEFDEPAKSSDWYDSLECAVTKRFESIESTRKLVLIDAQHGRSLEECPYLQVLKRDVTAALAHQACHAG